MRPSSLDVSSHQQLFTHEELCLCYPHHVELLCHVFLHSFQKWRTSPGTTVLCVFVFSIMGLTLFILNPHSSTLYSCNSNIRKVSIRAMASSQCYRSNDVQTPLLDSILPPRMYVEVLANIFDKGWSEAKGKVSVNDIPTNSASCLIGYLNFQCSDQRPEEVQKAFSASTTLIDDDQRPEEVQRTLPASTTPIDDDQRPEEVQKALSALTTLGGSPTGIFHRHPDADSNNEHVQKLEHLNQRASRTHRLHAHYYRLFIELE